MHIYVTVRCVLCGAERDIAPGEIKATEVPMCETCMSAMVPVRASASRPR